MINSNPYAYRMASLSIKLTLIALFLVFTIAPIVNAEDETRLSLDCVKNLPVPVETCYEEFLQKEEPDPDVWQAFVERHRHKDRIYLNQELGSVRIHAFEPKIQEFTYSLPQGVDPRSPHALILTERRRHVEVPYLSSGGWINILTLEPGLIGHSDVTAEVLRTQFKFNYQAQRVVADASQDPDFFDWTTDAAHAQTPSDENGLVKTEDLQNGAAAVGSFVKWLGGQTARVMDRCSAGDTRLALYWLGYALHAIQDLAPHKGRTFAEHSWNSYCPNRACNAATPQDDKNKEEGDPDQNPDNIVQARDYSIKFLEFVRTAIGDGCWRKMKIYTGRRVLFVEKTTTLGLDVTLTLAEYRRYKAAGPRFAKLGDRTANSIRWIGRQPDDVEKLLERIRRVIGG